MSWLMFGVSCAGKPYTGEQPMAELPAGLEAIMGDAGESCKTACAKSQRVCSEAHFQAVNGCNQLRQRFHCEAGCDVRSNDTAVPAYTISSAGKAERPAFCWVAPPASQQTSCDGASAILQRLCPCSAAEPTAVGIAALAEVEGIDAHIDPQAAVSR